MSIQLLHLFLSLFVAFGASYSWSYSSMEMLTVSSISVPPAPPPLTGPLYFTCRERHVT